ncbi:unnamed protein product [Auanema sp. JU1783]|nr:unnamed protein product [Auanema sp. JU1783]
MITAFVALTLVTLAQCTIVDLNCTSGTAYTSAANNCEDVYDTAACAVLYKDSKVAVDGTDERPTACFSIDSSTLAVDTELRDIAITNCPKTCGYCCLSKEWNCQNAPIPRITCNLVTKAMCKDKEWREIIAQDCPAACGFCTLGGCIDSAVDCATHPTICHVDSLKNFTTHNCQRTCGLCTGTTSGSCSPSMIENPNCASWKRNGFCTSTYYTDEHKKKYCGKTCNLC